MNFTNSWTGNWENAIRGLRHPMESYAKSDSEFGLIPVDWYTDAVANFIEKRYVTKGDPNKWDELIDYYHKNSEIESDNYEYYKYALIGPNDLDLAQRMIKAGSPNDKFLRQIFVSVDITAPLYW